MRSTRRGFLAGAGALVAWHTLRGAAVPAQAANGGAQAARPAGSPAQQASEAARMAADPLRPQYHLLPAANWMNDPDGPIYWRGKYHVFFQYNPNGAYWGDMHWAHAVSSDLVHWKHMPVALSPTPGGYDSAGCFTGSMVVENGTPTIVYTGVETVPASQATLKDGEHLFRETQCLATAADPELRSWKKLAKPVIALPPAGMKVTGFRDPCLWRDGDWWYMALGSGVAGVGGQILLYRSRDLRAWEYLHVLRGGEWSGEPGKNPVDTGEMWECPDFFELDGKHVLLYSTEGKVMWEVGEYDRRELKFHAQRSGLLDLGAFYAPKSMLGANGQRILWGWIPEKRPEADARAAGWAGSMALPRVLHVNSSGDLEMKVAEELQQLRQDAGVYARRGEAAAGAYASGTFRNLCGAVSGSFSAGSGAITLTLIQGVNPAATDPDGVGNSIDALLLLRYEPANEQVAHGVLGLDGKSLPLQLATGQHVVFEIYVDGSVVECFINNQIVMTKRVYPRGEAARQDVSVALSTETKDEFRLKVWQMQPISPDRLTS